MDPNSRMGGRFTAWLVLVALAFSGFAASASVLLATSPVGPDSDGSSVGVSDVPSVVFGAVGDFDNKAPAFPDMVALAKRLGNRGGMFLLALGDLGYVADEEQWCGVVKGAFNETLVVAGNHDTTENGPGDINNDVIYCPFNVDASLVPGPTYGYGKSYYFDYPRTGPLVRVVMITAGVTGTQVSGQNYASGGAEYTWVTNAVNGARTAGIPWVVVGLHKNCITVGEKTNCAMGQAMFDKLVGLKVDLVLAGHDHVYERSKQLALGTACPSVLSAGSFDPDCVVANGTAFTKGRGSLVVVDGAGGRDLYTVKIDGSDKEIGYFDAVMGTNANTESKASGHGALVVRLNATALTATTNFCPLGSTDAAGECSSKVSTTFSDAFTISTQAPTQNPTASFTYAPTWPAPGASLTFDASSSSDPNVGATLQVRWDWTNDGTFETSWSSTQVATHAYGAAGSYTAKLQVRDSLGLLANATRAVRVDGTPPATAASVSGPAGDHGWYRGNATVTLTATDDLSGVASTRARRDNATWVQTRSVTFTDDRAHVLDYTSTDVAGNVEPTHRITVPVDRSPPTTTAFLQGAQDPNGSYLVSVNLTLTPTDATSGVASTTYRIDGGPSQLYASPFPVAGPGSHVVSFASTDVAGNAEAPGSVSLTIAGASPPPPAVPPATALELAGTQGAGSWYTSVVTVTLTATSPSSAFVAIAYRLDGGTWNRYSAPFSVGDGAHILEYNATDGLGNAEAMQTASFRVDRVAPQTAIELSGTRGRDHWYIAPVSVRLTATDATSGVALTEYRLDGGVWTAYTAPVTVGNGRHVFDYRSTDAAGLTEVAPSMGIKVDASPPRVAVPATTDPVTVSPLEISWSVSDAISGVIENAVAVDGGPFESLGMNTTATVALSDGAHTIDIRAMDDAGNTVVAHVTLQVDTNLFSPTGPLRGMPSYLLLILIATGVVLFVIHRRRIRRERRRRAIARAARRSR